MNSLLKSIIVMFIAIVFSNYIVNLGYEEQSFTANPIRFFGTPLLLSIVMGFVLNWVNNRAKDKKVEK